MCSILIFAKADNKHPDETRDWQKFKRGDVIDISDDDNFFWGNEIEGAKALGWWRVVVLPGTPAKTMRSLLDGDPDTTPPRPRRLRINTINLDEVEKRATIDPKRRLVSSAEELLSLRSLKPAIELGQEIGEDRREIG